MDKFHRFILGLIAAAAFVASGVALPSSAFAQIGAPGNCFTDAECDPGFGCNDFGSCEPCLSNYLTGECIDQCSGNFDCAIGDYCDSGVCRQSLCNLTRSTELVIYIPQADVDQMTNSGSASDMIGKTVQAFKNDMNHTTNNSLACAEDGNNCGTAYTSKLNITEGNTCGSTGQTDCSITASTEPMTLAVPVQYYYPDDDRTILYAVPSLQTSASLTPGTDVDAALHSKMMNDGKYYVTQVYGGCPYNNLVAMKIRSCNC